MHVDKSFTKIQARVRPPPILAIPGFWEFLLLAPLPYLNMKTQSGGGHFPNPWRVNVPMANMPEFATDFKCKRGSNLDPEKRCAVW